MRLTLALAARPSARSRRRGALLATCATCAALGACASSAASPSTGGGIAGQERTIVGSQIAGQRDVELFRDRRGTREVLAAAPTAVWTALPDAYAGVGLEGLPVLGRERTLVAQPRLRRALNKVPLSQYLECGRMPTGERSADNYIIRLTVTSAVTAEGSGSAVATQVTATATAVDNSNSPVECSSTGRLESRIAAALAAALK